LRRGTCKAHANTHIRTLTHAHASSILERCSCVADRSRTLTQYHRETDTDTHFFDVLERELHGTIVVAVPHTRLRWATHRCTHIHKLTQVTRTHPVQHAAAACSRMHAAESNVLRQGACAAAACSRMHAAESNVLRQGACLRLMCTHVYRGVEGRDDGFGGLCIT
jgi:hypothetical protein